MDVVSNQTKPYHTKPYHTKPIHTKLYQTNYKSSIKQPKQVGSWWTLSSFSWMLSQTWPNHTIPNQTLPIQTNCIPSLTQPIQIRSWWKFHRTFRWMFSQTKPNLPNPSLNLLWNLKTKSDLDKTFTEASDGCCLKPNQTIQNQTKFSLSLFL